MKNVTKLTVTFWASLLLTLSIFFGVLQESISSADYNKLIGIGVEVVGAIILVIALFIKFISNKLYIEGNSVPGKYPEWYEKLNNFTWSESLLLEKLLFVLTLIVTVFFGLFAGSMITAIVKEFIKIFH